MHATAVVLQAPEKLDVAELLLDTPGEADAVVDVAFSGISTGTERLLWSGQMPAFPGMGYPLVPGYESVGVVRDAGPASGLRAGQTVFVPGAKCFGPVRGLFGASASRLVVPGARLVAIDRPPEDRLILLSLAATALHAVAGATPDLIVGHGVLGRLAARLAVAAGGAPTVWETNGVRRAGAEGYQAIDPATDERRDYRCILDVSGAADLLDTLIGRCARGGEIVLAGFYDRISFAFPPAFMRETRLRIAAEFRDDDLRNVTAMVERGALSLDGLITHHGTPDLADAAYRTAFGDAACLKMVLDWRA
jgi:3-hydroxyethyl bacteriochlorophyllide a dehydrogenase